MVDRPRYAALDVRGLVMARAVAFVHLDVSIAQDTMLVNIVQNHLAVLTAPMVPLTKLHIETVPFT